MWTVDSNDHGKELKMATDPTCGRKLRPLMPRSISSCCSTMINSPFSTVSSSSSPSYCCIQNPNILPWSRHPTSCVSDYGVVKREIQTVPLVSTRWNPTPEQLQALEEMYRRGTRTPSAEQIQQIAAKLRRFGKIEGKNVFYWFQNHKARERQKKRRQLELLSAKKTHSSAHHHKLETKQPPGLSSRYFEIEHHKKLPATPNCTTATPSEDSAAISMHGGAAAAAVLAPKPECSRKDHGWTQLLHHNTTTNATAAKINETCWRLDLSSCLHPPNNNNSSTHTITITAQKATGQENTKPSSSSLNLMSCTILLPTKNVDDDDKQLDDDEHETKDNQTLQLFPIRSLGLSTLNATTVHEEEDRDIASTKFTPNEFIEFLPIKN